MFSLAYPTSYSYYPCIEYRSNNQNQNDLLIPLGFCITKVLTLSINSTNKDCTHLLSQISQEATRQSVISVSWIFKSVPCLYISILNPYFLCLTSHMVSRKDQPNFPTEPSSSFFFPPLLSSPLSPMSLFNSPPPPCPPMTLWWWKKVQQ